MFTSIFNESLGTSVVPTFFKISVIIPVHKNSKPSGLNDYRSVALTSTVMKVFERLLKNSICSSIPVTLDLLQFAYHPNRSTENQDLQDFFLFVTYTIIQNITSSELQGNDDAISQVLHSSLTHIDSNNGNY